MSIMTFVIGKPVFGVPSRFDSNRMAKFQKLFSLRLGIS